MVESKIIIDKNKNLEDLKKLVCDLTEILATKECMDAICKFQRDKNCMVYDTGYERYANDNLISRANKLIVRYVTDEKAVDEKQFDTTEEDLYI